MPEFVIYSSCFSCYNHAREYGEQVLEREKQGEVYAEFQKKDVEGTARFIPVVVKIIAITSANSSNRARAQKQ